MAEIVFNSPSQTADLESQIQNLQTTLASLNQQIIVLQEALQERDQKIKELEKAEQADHTLTIVGLLINLYKFLLPGKVI